MVAIPDEIQEELAVVKEKKYCLKSEQEFYENLIRLGLKGQKQLKELEK